jgi:acyl carrier protein
MYGPTETTVWSTCHRLAARDGPVLIGHPIANTQVYVLSRTRQPVPVGVPGEIYIGGLGVARGYLGRDELTGERFLPDPFRAAPGARMYRTGDVGRYLTDGNLEFRSRADNQVKVRGFRIELGEVETALAAHAAVKQAVAAVVQAGPGDARLVAYVLAEDSAELPAAALREHLRRTLPHYMIPQHFVAVERFPLTPNGKVDRAQLPASGMIERAIEEAYVPPRTAAEQAVAEVWADVMAVPRVSADANFFELGGHSVLAVRVVSRLRRELGVPLTLRHVFLAPTVAALAREIEGLQPASSDGPPGVPDEEEVVF